MPRVTGHVRREATKGGEVYRAKLKVYDPSGAIIAQPNRTIGPAWTKRSRPPEGHFTEAMAEAALPRKVAEVEAEFATAEEPTSGALTFGDICAEYLIYAETIRKVRRSTLNGYRKEIDRVLIPEFGRDTPAEDITTARIEDWQEERLGDDVKADTVNHNVGCMRRIYKRARKVHGIQNTAAEVENVPVKRSGDYTVLQPDQVIAVAAEAVNLQDRVIVTVAAFCGLRLSELRALRWRDVRWTDSLIYVRLGHVEGVDDDPKGGRVRGVPLVDQAAAALDELSRREHFTGDEDRVFVNELGGPVEASALRRRWYSMLEAAGYPRDAEGDPYMRFHDLRHTFGSIAVRIPGATLPDVQALMGHANITTTMRYVHTKPRTDEAARFSDYLRKAIDGEDSKDSRSIPGPSDGGGDAEFGSTSCRRRDSNPRHADYDSAALTS